jgi:hypothetical protein
MLTYADRRGPYVCRVRRWLQTQGRNAAVRLLNPWGTFPIDTRLGGVWFFRRASRMAWRTLRSAKQTGAGLYHDSDDQQGETDPNTGTIAAR